MTEIRKYIQDQRKKYKMSYPPEMKMGSRFRSDSDVERRLRMMYFEKEYDNGTAIRLPRIDQVPMSWIENNINKCFDSLCEADWHFTNPEKWIAR